MEVFMGTARSADFFGLSTGEKKAMPAETVNLILLLF